MNPLVRDFAPGTELRLLSLHKKPMADPTSDSDLARDQRFDLKR
jgi:hypothetical protein